MAFTRVFSNIDHVPSEICAMGMGLLLLGVARADVSGCLRRNKLNSVVVSVKGCMQVAGLEGSA